MQRPDISSLSRGVVLRGVGFGVAVVLGAVAVWLIVTSDSLKWHDLGVLCGLWGLLLGAIAVGSRRGSSGEHPAEGSAHDAGDRSGTGIELRSTRTQVEHAQEVAARRAHEARIEQLLQQEIRAAVNREVGTLRAEIAQLRTDLLEKVGGQLRLEHIETTRVIGSDLEALQEEIRALKAIPRDSSFPAATIRDLGRVHLHPAERSATAEPHRASAAPVRPDRQEDRGGRIVEVESSVVKTAVVDASSLKATPAGATGARRPDDTMTGPIRRSEQVDPPAGRPSVSPAAGGPTVSPAAGGPSVSPAAGGQAVSPAAAAQSAPPATGGPSVSPAAGGPTVSPAAGGQSAPQRSRPVAPASQEPAPASGAPDEPRPTAAPTQRNQRDVPASLGSPAVAKGSDMGADVADVFAGLPRLSRFVDDSPEGASASPVPSGRPVSSDRPATSDRPVPADRPASSDRRGPSEPQAPATGEDPPSRTEHTDRVGYHGRRRRLEQEERTDFAAEPGLPRGQHSSSGRRHRDDDRGEDVLARLLAREKH